MLDPKNIGPEQEQYEYFTDNPARISRCRYDYRDSRGELFSCVRLSLEDCRNARDIWLGKTKNRPLR